MSARKSLTGPLPVDSGDCQHPGRPTSPRLVDEGSNWHCEICDTSFIVDVQINALWKEL